MLNIIIKIRLGARKFIRLLRQPVAERVKNIGIWYRILNSVGKISVITNCLVFIISSLICWLIPDIPKSVNLQIRHENHIINDMIIEHELRKAKYLALNEKKKKRSQVGRYK
ncbi:anoctamin-1-like isoform X3 [Tachypleus tridentatus]|uniref:anoctamin-1-like isoform X3 n=1 Tax=Tachypleus tridentatus TaxID=6853 RepID=UPI003FD6492B